MVTITSEKLNNIFKGKRVKIIGVDPGDKGSVWRKNYTYDGVFDDAWDSGDTVGFSAAEHTWPGVDEWTVLDEGKIMGYYSALMFPNREEWGFFQIEIVKNGGTI